MLLHPSAHCPCRLLLHTLLLKPIILIPPMKSPPSFQPALAIYIPLSISSLLFCDWVLKEKPFHFRASNFSEVASPCKSRQYRHLITQLTICNRKWEAITLFSLCSCFCIMRILQTTRLWLSKLSTCQGFKPLLPKFTWQPSWFMKVWKRAFVIRLALTPAAAAMCLWFGSRVYVLKTWVTSSGSTGLLGSYCIVVRVRKV